MAIRENIQSLSPVWLQSDVSVRLMYTIALHIDRLIEKALQGSVAHQPGLGTPTALAALGAARLIPRGVSETDDEYAARLRQSWDAWSFAGSNRGILQIVLAILLELRPDALTVSKSTSALGYAIWDEYLSGDDFEHVEPSHTVDLDWNWDNANTIWWRVFLVIYSIAPNATWTAPAKWGSGGTWGDGRAWGCVESNAIGTTINAALKNWRAAQTWLQWWIVSFDADLFRPNNRPDGTWGRWSKIVGGQYVSSRNQNASYASGPGTVYP